MKKETFLNKLRKKLSILEESEIEDIIIEYDGYIEEKIAKGSTEEEAVQSMGNVDELARELLAAYKVKNPEKKDTFNNLADGFMNIFEEIVDVFSNKSFHDILRFIVELIFIFLIIAVCKIPFSLIEEMGRSVIFTLCGNSIHSQIYLVLHGVWNFILEFAYLIFAVLLFIRIFDSRYLQHSKTEKVEVESEKKENSKPRKSERKEKEVVIEKETQKKSDKSIIDLFTDIWMWFIKFICIFVLIGVVCYLMGMAAAIGISIYFLVKGIFYFGIYFVLASLFGLGVVAFFLLFNFIFNRKGKLGLMLICTLVCLGFLGAGAGICTLEFANTEIIYEEGFIDEKEQSVLVNMKDDLVLWRQGAQDILVDESLGNQIRVVYHYSAKYFDIRDDVEFYQRSKFTVLHPGYEVKKFHSSHDFFESLIQDLKDKKIHFYNFSDVDIDIYASSEVKAKLIENELKFNHSYAEKDTLEDLCDDLEDLGYNLPHYCREYEHHYDM